MHSGIGSYRIMKDRNVQHNLLPETATFNYDP